MHLILSSYEESIQATPALEEQDQTGIETSGPIKLYYLILMH